MPTRHRSSPPAAHVALAGALLAAFLAVPGEGQDRPEPGTVFGGETTVLAVEIPVQVLLDGEPVRGLTAESFAVYSAGESVALTGFETIDLSLTGAGTTTTPGSAGAVAPAGGGLPVPTAGRRHFLLLFDLSFTEPGYLPRALEGARDLLRDGLHPSDLVGVAFYSERQGASLVLHFTPDRRQVETVLDAFESLLDGERRGEDTAAVADPLRLTAGGWLGALAEVGQAAGYQTSDFAEALGVTSGVSDTVGGRWADNILAHSAEFSEQVIRERRGAQVSYLTDGIGELVRGLRSVRGAKHLVMFSQGFDANLATPMENWSANNPAAGRGAGGWVLREMNELVAELKRSGWILHGADLKGIEHPFERGGSASFKGSLFFLAEETGGMLVENTNELAAGLEDVLERTAVTYVLAFEVDGVPVDGGFHAVRVELVGGPRGARVVHRGGYHAPSPSKDRDPFEARSSAATLLMAGDEVFGLPARLFATTLEYQDGRARVPVMLEMADPGLVAPSAEPKEAGGATEVYVYAFDASGSVAGFFASSVRASAAADGGDGPLRGLKVAGELRLPPGRYDLRALVRGPGTGREAVRTVRFEVPAAGSGPRLLPPLFVQGSGERWAVVTVGGGESGGDGYPFTLDGKRFAPAASPEIPRDRATRLLLPGLGLTGEGVTLATRIVDASGSTVHGEHVEVVGRRAPAVGQPDLFVGRLDPAGLEPGSYILEVTLAGTGDVMRAPFRVLG